VLRSRLFVVSAVALFLELALIRYVGSEVRIFAYFKNLILIACFFGFGLGFFRAASRPRLGLSLGLLVAVLVGMWAGTHAGPLGLSAPSVAFSNFADSLTMGEEDFSRDSPASVFVAGVFWVLLLFGAAIGVMFGFAQRIGRDIELYGRELQIQAYSWNVAGSLVGILAFGLCSRLSLPPACWFVPAMLATLPFLDERRSQGLAAAGTIAVGVLLVSLSGPTWSPYQKLELDEETRTVTVNGTGYMTLRSFQEQLPPGQADRWRHPLLLRPGAKRVLIVGAGAGNDAAAALAAGAERVTAVEIDPAIHALGLAHHPDAPYSDPRVDVVIDDARHFGETTDQQFDLVVFSHLDSHTALSSYTNVRLDNYIYTVESFRTFKELLAPGGAMFVSFWATREWVPARLAQNMTEAFGRAPLNHARNGRMNDHAVSVVELFATDDEALRQRALLHGMTDNELPEGSRRTILSTDDWPYLFVSERAVPTAMLLLALILGVVTLAGTWLLVAPELRRGGGFPLDRHFFCLGAAFLLVEVHDVGKLARVFGTTWSVNAWVITGILLMILAANALAARHGDRLPMRLLYVGLVGTLLAGAFVPIESLLGLPLHQVVVSGFYTLPLLFAGLIFAKSFIAAERPMRALGSNILGSLLGGFLELSSFRIGISGLLLIAVVLYLASYPRARARA
jgi:spermidine synthase